MTVAPDLIARIKDAAMNLPIACDDTLFLDKLLGELDLLVHDARLEIDIEWREARRAAAAQSGTRLTAPSPSLESLA